MSSSDACVPSSVQRRPSPLPHTRLLGGSYNSSNFGTQDVVAIGTSQVFQNGTLVSTGIAAGPGTVDMPSELQFAPTIQAGYFRHFGNDPWLWGAKLPVQLPGYPIDGRERRRPSVRIVHRPRNQQDHSIHRLCRCLRGRHQTRLKHQLELMPFIGHSFEKGFVYLGGGPTGSNTQTNI